LSSSKTSPHGDKVLALARDIKYLSQVWGCKARPGVAIIRVATFESAHTGALSLGVLAGAKFLGYPKCSAWCV
jgi:hypothetical protein